MRDASTPAVVVLGLVFLTVLSIPGPSNAFSWSFRSDGHAADDGTGQQLTIEQQRLAEIDSLKMKIENARFQGHRLREQYIAEESAAPDCPTPHEPACLLQRQELDVLRARKVKCEASFADTIEQGTDLAQVINDEIQERETRKQQIPRLQGEVKAMQDKYYDLENSLIFMQHHVEVTATELNQTKQELQFVLAEKAHLREEIAELEGQFSLETVRKHLVSIDRTFGFASLPGRSSRAMFAPLWIVL